MSSTTDLTTLKINYLTQQQYDDAAQQGDIEADELYLTPAQGGGVTDVEVDGTSVVTGGVAEVDLTGKSDVGHTHTTSDITDFPTIPTKVSDLNNDSGFSSVSFTRYTTTGTNIADIEIDGTTTKIYAPTSGGGGVTDYDQLTSRPQINSTTLTGNKSSSDLGLASASHTHTTSQITDFPAIPTITDTYSGTSSDGMSGKAVKSAIDALDGTVSGTAGSGKTLTAFSQTDGKVSATFGNISITKSQVSDFPAIPTKVSDLTNDSGYITGYTETDPVFSASAAAGITSSDISTWNGKSDFSGDYNDLTNKPTIPANTSDLNNDSGFITTETDPTVPSWAKASTKPTYTASEVGALPDTTTIPTNTSDLNNDSGFISADGSGNVSLSGSITTGGHDSEIGYRTTRQSGSYSVATGTSWVTVPAANLTRITLSPGVWIMHAQVSFASNSTGWRGLRIYDVTTSESIGRSSVTQPACNGATTNMNTMTILSLTESNTFTLQVVQNSSNPRNVDLQFHAVRIA